MTFFKKLIIVSMLSSGSLLAADFNFTHVLGEGYWYSRYNVGNLVMKSGNGDSFKPNKEMVQNMVNMASDDLSRAVPPSNPALLKRVYNIGNPHFSKMSNGNPSDFSNFRWSLPIVTQTSHEAFGWTLIKVIEWSKQFNVDVHFGSPNGIQVPAAQQRFAGLVLCAQAMMQFKEFNEKPELFDGTDIGGQYIALSSISNLSQYIGMLSNRNMAENRCAKVAAMMMNKTPAEVSADILKVADKVYALVGTPTTIREKSFAIQSLTWYAFANQSKKEQLKTDIAVLGDSLINTVTNDVVELAYLVRGLIEASRVTRKVMYMDAAVKFNNQLVLDFDKDLGLFKNKNLYKVEDTAAIIGAFNAMRLFAKDKIDQSVLKTVFTKFFDSVMNKARLQISAPSVLSLPEFERKTDHQIHRGENLPFPSMAGGEFGISPVLAASVEYKADGTFTSESGKFETAGAMHLSNEMIWFHNEEVSGFPCPNLETGCNLESTFDIIHVVMSNKCTACHSGSGAPHGLDLSTADLAFDNLVNKPSREIPAVKLVYPGEADPTKSYLIAKIIESSAHRVGARMPPSGPSLSTGEIDLVKSWITKGAKR